MGCHGMSRDVTPCFTVQHDTVEKAHATTCYGAMPRTTERYSKYRPAQHDTVHCGTIQGCTVQCRHRAILYRTRLHYTVHDTLCRTTSFLVYVITFDYIP